MEGGAAWTTRLVAVLARLWWCQPASGRAMRGGREQERRFPSSSSPNSLLMSVESFEAAVAFVGSSTASADNQTKLRVRPSLPILLINSLTSLRFTAALRPLQDRHHLQTT